MKLRESDISFGFLIMRLIVGLTFFMAGLRKVLNYVGTVDYLQSGFAETWLPDFLLTPFAYALPLLELGLGLLIFLGLFTRPALYAVGILMLFLNFGLMVKSDNAGAAKNIPYFIIIVLDIILLNYNKYALDNFLFGRKAKNV